MRRATIFSWLIAPILIAGMIVAVINQRAIYDWWFLRSYTPTPQIESIADEAQLSEVGRRYFYVGDPQLLTKDTFADNCTFAEYSIVVGCYNGQNIYILDIENEELDDGEIVTAAHEMLHAAYDRLSSGDRDEINSWVLRDSESVKDKDVLETMALYRESTEAREYVNELHSILATEVYNLSDELEEYYSRYFTNRVALVDIAQAYDKVFTELEEEVEALADELNRLADSINAQGESLEARFVRLETQRAILQRRIDDGETGASISAAIDSFEASVKAYNDDVASYRADIARYEELRVQYEEDVIRHEELIRSLDSSIMPIDIAE